VYSPFLTLVVTGLPRTQHPQQSIDTIHAHLTHWNDCSVDGPAGVSHADWWISLNTAVPVIAVAYACKWSWQLHVEPQATWDENRMSRFTHSTVTVCRRTHSDLLYRPTTLKDYVYRRPAQGGWLQWLRLCAELGRLTHRRQVSAAACCCSCSALVFGACWSAAAPHLSSLLIYIHLPDFILSRLRFCSFQCSCCCYYYYYYYYYLTLR